MSPDEMVKTGVGLMIIGAIVPIVGIVGLFFLAIGVKRGIWPDA